MSRRRTLSQSWNELNWLIGIVHTKVFSAYVKGMNYQTGDVLVGPDMKNKYKILEIYDSTDSGPSSAFILVDSKGQLTEVTTLSIGSFAHTSDIPEDHRNNWTNAQVDEAQHLSTDWARSGFGCGTYVSRTDKRWCEWKILGFSFNDETLALVGSYDYPYTTEYVSFDKLKKSVDKGSQTGDTEIDRMYEFFRRDLSDPTNPWHKNNRK